MRARGCNDGMASSLRDVRPGEDTAPVGTLVGADPPAVVSLVFDVDLVAF